MKNTFWQNGSTKSLCLFYKCFKCKGFGHKAIDCRSTSSTCEQEKSTLKSFEETSSSNTPKRKMKKVWRLKKIPSTDDGTKNSLEDQYSADSKIEGSEKEEAPNQGEHLMLF